MASVSSTNSSVNSFFNTYGNANAVTGLASGMDTEGMIEQATSSFQKKIESLQQKQTVVQWKQTQLRSMITMLNNLNGNYASYLSKTNLLSPSFFTNAMTYAVTGANADKISAVGGSKNNISIDSVAKLATAATYRVDAGAVFGGADGTGEKIDWKNLDLSENADGLIAVTLDGVDKIFRIGDLGDKLSDIKDTDALAAALQKQVDKAFGAGRVTVENKDGALSFSAKGSSVEVVSNESRLGLGTGVRNYVDTGKTKVVDALCKYMGGDKYTYDGKTYTEEDGRLVDDKGNALALEINGTKIEVSASDTIADLVSKINHSDAGVTVSYSQVTGQFTFTAKETGAGGRIEFGGVLGSVFQPSNEPKNVSAAALFGDIKWDEKGEAKIIINGADLITLKKTDTMEDMIKKIEEIDNGFYKGMIQYDPEEGTYGMYDADGNPMDGSRITFKVSGSDTKLSLTELVGNANSLKPVYTEGQDAELTVTINGVETKLTRSSNTFDLDGMSVTLKGTFNVDEDGNTIAGSEPVTFTGKVDSEKIVSAVRSFVEDYNAIIKAVREAYTTQPPEKSRSTHAKYEPLTDADKEGLSEKTIEEYENKAKTGLLYMDGDLSALYSELRGILMANQSALAEIGISVAYDSDSRSNYLVLDEEKLTAALESDVDKVASVFTDMNGEGGLMTSVQSTVKKFASTSIGDYGVLVRRAGADESSISQRDSSSQKELERLENQIDTWRSKLSAKVDYYSRQFSMLEQLMGTYNNQSSMLMSMMGY